MKNNHSIFSSVIQGFSIKNILFKKVTSRKRMAPLGAQMWVENELTFFLARLKTRWLGEAHDVLPTFSPLTGRGIYRSIFKGKIYICLLIVFLSNIAFSQSTYQITNIPGNYYGKVETEPGTEEEIFKKGTISIYHSSTHQKLISVTADEMVVESENDKNIPYQSQELVFYEDFNFDGIKDFAVLNGQLGCYHQPSYEIYLASGNTFVYHDAFSELAQSYCGMFQIIPEKKMLTTRAKSGCCWHEYRDYVVENNSPKLKTIIEEDATIYPYTLTTTKTWDGDKMSQKEEKTVSLHNETPVISFKIAKNGKQATLFIHQDRTLNYVLTKPNGLVEFNYPEEAHLDEEIFTLNETGNTTSVSFQNGEAEYEVYQTRENGKIAKVGINVKVNGKLYHLPGDPASLEGDLKNTGGKGLANLR